MTDLQNQPIEPKAGVARRGARPERYLYPPRPGNQFEFLVDGEVFFQRIYADIASAKRYVLMEMYLCASGKVFSQFIAAVLTARSKQVDVYLLLDDYGAKKVRAPDLETLRAAGVFVAMYNPVRWFQLKNNLYRTHRKILVIDGQIAYTGGAGLSDEFANGDNPSDYWHDVMVRIVGPCVDDWGDIFTRAFRVWAPKIPLAHLPVALAHEADGYGRVVLNRSARDSEIRRSLIKHMLNAQKRVWITVPYFVPSRKFRSKLRACAARGVDTCLLLPGPITDNIASRYMAHRYYKKLLKNGVKIYEYQPRFIHSKIFIADDWCSIGSSNLDRWNLVWNLDANQEIYSPEFTAQVAAQFVQDFAQSKLFDLETWQRRPLFERFVEKFWGFIVHLLSRFSRDAEKRSTI